MRYALKNISGEVLRYQDFEIPPSELAPEKGLSWVLSIEPEPARPLQEEIDANAAARVRSDRDEKIRAIEWRVLRNQREVRMGLTVTEDISAVDAYIQALADIAYQPGFPHVVNWPVIP